MSNSVNLGPIGIWTGQLDYQPARRAQEAVAELEQLGFAAIWFPEAVGREALTNAGLLLAGTSTIVVATGIASIYGRDPVAMAAAQNTLGEAYAARFILGLGVSHSSLVEEVRGHSYDKPLPAMSAYLDAMDRTPYRAVPPAIPPTRVLAALGPKMLRLAAERAGGAHTYNVTPQHTAQAREILGQGPLLVPEQAVVLETDPARARGIGRAFISYYLSLPNYTNNFRRLGFDDTDLAGGGSDRLVDAIVAWGQMEKIVDRVRAHQSAGADHVCIQALNADPRGLPTKEWRDLAAALVQSQLATG